MVTTLQQPTANGQQQAPSVAGDVAPNAISTAALEQYIQRASEQQADRAQLEQTGMIDVTQLRPDSPMLYVLDNRIIPDQVGFKDSVNPNIRLHPRDIADPAREPFLRDKLEPLFSLLYPSYHETEIRKPFITALRDVLKKDPTLSDDPPASPFPPPIPESPFNTPLSHIVNGQPFPELLSEAELARYRDANAIYLMLEYKLAKKSHTASDAIDAGGYPTLLRDTVNNLTRRGVNDPSIDQLILEVGDALGVTVPEFVRTASTHGVQGIAELLHIKQPLLDDIMALMDYSKMRSFPLNDVINWEYGRAISPPNTPISEMIAYGKEQRIEDTIQTYRKTLTEFGAVPNQMKNEMLLASALDSVPPLLRELFFEINGQIIFTQEPDLYNVINKPATGFNLSYQSSEAVDHSLNQVFISGNLGLPRTTRTIVHEMNHMLFPDDITPDEAVRSDTLLNRDEVRLHIFKELVDQFAIAVAHEDNARQNEIIAILDSPEYAVGGKNFSEMLAGMDMDVFIGAVNESFQYLQMESPSYNRISAYQKSEDRFKEIWPRLSELRYVEYRDRPQIMDFIVPNLIESYNEIYLPHLQRRLEYLHQHQPSRAEMVIASLQGTNPLEETLYTGNIKDLRPWEETLFGGDVTISHPAGDTKPVSFAGIEGERPSVQNYTLKRPTSLQQIQEDGVKPLILINPDKAQLLARINNAMDDYGVGLN